MNEASLLENDSLSLKDTNPHDSWARFYDYIYSQMEGFNDYTRISERLLKAHFPAPKLVLDLGSGTGRLAIPLAQSGNYVTAVEISSGMIDVLRSKIRKTNSEERVKISQGLIQEFDSPPDYGRFELVICLQTVLNYLLEDGDLNKLADIAARHTTFGGCVLIDFAEMKNMRSVYFSNEEFSRTIKVHSLGKDRFRVSEVSGGNMNGEVFTHQPQDLILRYWSVDTVTRIFESKGFKAIPVSSFAALKMSGSHFCAFRKE